MNNADSFGSGNYYGAAASVGSMMNPQSLNSVSLTPMSKTNSPLISNQANMHNQQQGVHVKPQPIDQMEKMNFQSSSSRDGNLQSHQQQQFQQQPNQFQQQQQLVHHQRQQKQQNQQPQHLLNTDAFGQSPMTSDLSSQAKRDMDHHNEVMHSEQFQMSEMHNQYHQHSADDRLRNAQHNPSSQHDLSSSLSQTSQQMQQMLHPHQLIAETRNDFSSLSVGAQSESVVQGQWRPQLQDGSHRQVHLSHEQHVQEDFRQRISGQDEAQCNNLSSEGTNVSQTVASRSTSQPPNKVRFRNQQRWLLFLRHARKCPASEGKCQESNCLTMQKLLKHIEKCISLECEYPHCTRTKKLIHHHKNCSDSACPVCVPVKNYIQKYNKAQTRLVPESGVQKSVNGSCAYDSGDTSARLISKTPQVVETSEDPQPSMKRLKIEQSSQSIVPDCVSNAETSAIKEPHVSQDIQIQDYQHSEISIPVKSEFTEVKMEATSSSGQGNIDEMKDSFEDNCNQRHVGGPAPYNEPACLAKQEIVKLEKETDSAKQENSTQTVENPAGTKSGKPKIKGVSLTELFTPEQVRAHITGLRQWVGQVGSLLPTFSPMVNSVSFIVVYKCIYAC